tara:strand:+ start:242 stop:487 length:246 start_codon:yes stop_codon:yes gene_type:complete
MLDPIGIIKIAETKGVAMIDRFSKLYKESAVKKAEQKLSMQLSKARQAVEKFRNGSSGLKLSEGSNRGKILGHQKIEAKKL